jgi:ferrous-iron efflux pump FieF
MNEHEHGISPHAPPVIGNAGGHMMTRAAIASVSVSAVLLLVKAIAFAMTGSVAILAALADSGVDLFASVMNLLAVRHALTPSDAEHRFGHAKAEPLAGLGQAAFISGSATFLVWESIQHLLEPHALSNGGVGLAVMAFSIFATIGLITYQRIVVKRTGSLAISADRMHYVGDLLTNFGVMVGIVLSTQLGWYIADPLIGLGVAFVLGWSAWQVFRQSYDQLMDRELPEADRIRIKEIVRAHPEVRGLHDLRTRAAGTTSFIQFHLEMAPDITLSRAHQLSDAVEEQLQESFPGAEIIIHQDPAGLETVPTLAQN